MPAKRELTMRQLRHMLRLAHEGVSAREMGRRLGVARSTIQDNLKRAAAAGLNWPLPEDLTDDALEKRLFTHAGVKTGARRRVEPDWAELSRELKRPGVNMMILWEEYRAAHPDGYGYSRFCDLFRGFERRLTPVMRQHHVAGDKVFVDYSGKRIGIVNPATGEIREAEIFVAVLGASNLTYAEATWTQKLPDWTGAHVRLFRFFGGTPRLLVLDNLKSGVHKASFYDPEINRTYGALASHYGVGVLPARPRKPRDKAKVEAGVRFAQSYILGRLRRLLKRSLDVVGGSILFAIAVPVYLVTAAAIKLTSRGPVLYKQVRLGVNGTEFTMLKFRSMYRDADKHRALILGQNEQDGGGVLFKMREDPRVTPVGRLIRRLSIDELPQLAHVLSGRMSLVGPRPLAAEDSVYTGSARRRLLVRPGLTGLWQVSGRSELSWDDAVRLDLYYVENWSLGLDLSILARTAFTVLTRKGAY